MVLRGRREAGKAGKMIPEVDNPQAFALTWLMHRKNGTPEVSYWVEVFS